MTAQLADTRAASMPSPSPSEASTLDTSGALAFDLATVSVLWRRDLMRFVREKSRVIGALVQPFIFWLVIGSGMAKTFRLPGAEGVGYLEYFFPGVILMVVLFTSIFATMSLIEDRHQGFLQAVLVGPGSRVALVLGKCLGATTIAVLQATMFLLLAPAAGFSPSHIAFVPLGAALVLTALGLAALGFAVAWWLDSTQGYHVVMSVLLLPLWILSGAMFPGGSNAGAIAAIMRVNPMSYATDAIRRALYGGIPPVGTTLAGLSGWFEIGALGLFATVCCALAVWVCYRRR